MGHSLDMFRKRTIKDLDNIIRRINYLKNKKSIEKNKEKYRILWLCLKQELEEKINKTIDENIKKLTIKEIEKYEEILQNYQEKE